MRFSVSLPILPKRIMFVLLAESPPHTSNLTNTQSSCSNSNSQDSIFRIGNIPIASAPTR